MFNMTRPEHPLNLRSLWIGLSLVTMALAMAVGYRGIGLGLDAKSYRMLAEGRTDLVGLPFANRQLHALLVHALQKGAMFSLATSFAVIGVFCLAVMVLLTFRMLAGSGVPIWVGTLVGLSYFWSLNFGNYYLPDLFDAFLLTIFLYFLWSGWYLLAMLMLFPLEITRESTSLVLVCLLIAGFRRLRWYLLTVAVVAFACGKQVVSILTKAALSNRHHLSEGLYDLLKMPWSFARNVLGVRLWTSTLQDFCQQPLWVVNFPGHLHFGGIHNIGYCGYDPDLQLIWVLASFSLFGLLPLFLVFLMRQSLKSLWPDDVLLRFCILYGGISFLLTPLLGASVDRLAAYSWPAFLLGVPLLMIRNRAMERLPWRTLLALHIVICWMSMMPLRFALSRSIYAIVALVDLSLFVWAWRLVKKAYRHELASA